uniref:BEN domain containing 7 n=1 Tax=Electrophorus electricus TaxID=8005 RepID=A0A4W4ERM2_ELEEL
MEIKRQITGMMRLLSDKAGRVYQRATREGDALKQEPQEEVLGWPVSQNQAPGEPQNPWSPTPPVSQYDTRSKTQKIMMTTCSCSVSDLVLPPVPATVTTGSTCCMCNCKSTLQAILLELRTMRKLMQTQRGSQEKHCSVSSTCSSYSSAPRKRSHKRRAVHKVTALTPPSARTATPPYPPLISEPVCLSQPEVRLAEDYDVFIPKAQLDSILVNYTRSGSLLFRKLVCAFFDDTTLANSLPNGKRKRGLNDHRKGLDQNIVGAIKGGWASAYRATHNTTVPRNKGDL